MAVEILFLFQVTDEKQRGLITSLFKIANSKFFKSRAYNFLTEAKVLKRIKKNKQIGKTIF